MTKRDSLTMIEHLRYTERERCAKIAERYERKCGSVNGRKAALDIASEIRASDGEKEESQ
jgi:hypothetical protein